LPRCDGVKDLCGALESRTLVSDCVKNSLGGAMYGVGHSKQVKCHALAGQRRPWRWDKSSGHNNGRVAAGEGALRKCGGATLL